MHDRQGSTPSTVQPTGFARARHLLPVLGISKSKFWKDVREGRFPPPVQGAPFGPAVTCWRWEDVHAFIRGEWKPAGGAQ